MKSLRAHGTDEARTPALSTPHLHAVSRSAPPRPRWGILYLVVLVIGAVGTAAHLVVRQALALEIVDLSGGAALLAALAAWIRVNRIALSRVDEPTTGTTALEVRIVRSRRRSARSTDELISGIDGEDRVIIPYDFR